MTIAADDGLAARGRTEGLYREHGAAVWRICRALLRDRAEAEDALQQVFLSAHRALLNGAGPRDPGAWLATIARNECRARTRSRRLTLVSGDVDLDAVEHPAPDPASETIRRNEVAELWRAVAALPGSQRDALVLRELHGLSYEQLGERLSLSEPSVRSLLSRARARLRQVAGALGGASWLDALARALAGGSGAVAPAAGKAIVVGAGAALVGGGLLVARPDHHPVVPRPAVVQRQAATRSPRPAAAAARRLVVASAVVASPPPAPVRRQRVAPSRSPDGQRRDGRSPVGTPSGDTGDGGGHGDTPTPLAVAPPPPETSGDGVGDGSSAPAVAAQQSQEGGSGSGSGDAGGGGGSREGAASSGSGTDATVTVAASSNDGGGDQGSDSGSGSGGDGSGRGG